MQEVDPPKTPRGDLPLYLTVTEGEPRSGGGGTLGHRMLVALGLPMPLALAWNQCYCIRSNFSRNKMRIILPVLSIPGAGGGGGSS